MAMNSHWLICGPTGAGKSTLLETELMKRAGRYSIVGIFPHAGDVATRLVQRLWFMHRKKVVWDSASSFDRVFRLRRCLPSEGEGFRRKVENDETKQRLIEAMLARRQQQNVYEMPLIEDGLARGLDLWLNQTPIKPESWINDAFRPGEADRPNRRYAQLLAECSDNEAYQRAVEVNGWTKQERLKTLLPAKRVVEGTFGSPLYLSRTEGKVSLGELIDEGKMCFFEGSSTVSRPAARFWFITIIHEVCRAVERGVKKPVILVIDEASSWVLVDSYLCRMLAELRKFGLQVWISVQVPSFDDEKTLEEILTNCNRIYCFRPQSKETAILMGYLMGMPVLDPDAVHWIEERFRQVHDGYFKAPTESMTRGETEDVSLTETWSSSSKRGTNEGFSEDERTGETINKDSVSENSSSGQGHRWGSSSDETRGIGGAKSVRSGKSQSKTDGFQYLSKFKEVKQEIPHYFSVSDQVTILTGKMMSMEVGECMVKDQGKVWFEKVKKLPEIPGFKSLQDLRMQEIRTEIKSQALFQEPFTEEPPKRPNAADRVNNKDGQNEPGEP